MAHLRLIKALSYSGLVAANKKKPDVYCDNTVASKLLATGYFEQVDDGIVEKTDIEEVEFKEVEDEQNISQHIEDFSTLTIEELKLYAAQYGIDVSSCKKKEDYVKTIEDAMAKANEAREALRINY